MSFVLVGNYGVGNLGDEALKEYLLDAYPDVDWIVASAHPVGDEVPRLPAGVRSFFCPWWKTIGAMKRSDGVVFGGGSLYTDVESTFACILWWWHAFIAHLLGKKIYLAFQGIGPFRSSIGEKCARWVVKRAAFISLRDELSASRIGKWAKKVEVMVTFDPVFKQFVDEPIELTSNNHLLVIPRHNSGETIITITKEVLQERDYERVHILLMQPSSAEMAFAERMDKLLEKEVRIVTVRSIRELVGEVQRALFVISERYHGALAALARGKECEIISQGEGDKLASLGEVASVRELLDSIQEGEGALRGALS